MTSTTRTTFSLDGPSISLDGRTQAVRGDLADIALAGKLFVPHYAKPMPMTCTVASTPLKSTTDAEGEQLAILSKDDTFMAVDMSGGWAWGFKADDHLVGYVELSALEQAK